MTQPRAGVRSPGLSSEASGFWSVGVVRGVGQDTASLYIPKSTPEMRSSQLSAGSRTFLSFVLPKHRDPVRTEQHMVEIAEPWHQIRLGIR